MIKILVDENDLLDALVNRVSYWTDDEDVIKLYELMYQNYIDGCMFENMEVDIMKIVDNDYINYCRVICPEDGDEYDKIKKIYDIQGLCDCSCECNSCDFIEAEYNGYFLVR